MSGTDVLAIVVSVAVGIAVVGLLFTLASAMRAMTVFRRSVEEITRNTVPILNDMHVAIKQANTDLVKVDDLLETADSISHTVDSASRLAYTAFANPVMKAIAASTGTARAFWLFRRRRARPRKRR
ncbi:MAG: DUF948 domain-containing protein [Acidimicrobiales bacterium]